MVVLLGASLNLLEPQFTSGKIVMKSYKVLLTVNIGGLYLQVALGNGEIATDDNYFLLDEIVESRQNVTWAHTSHSYVPDTSRVSAVNRETQGPWKWYVYTGEGQLILSKR